MVISQLLVIFIPDHATKHQHFIVSNFRKTFHLFLEYEELPALPILQITFYNSLTHRVCNNHKGCYNNDSWSVTLDDFGSGKCKIGGVGVGKAPHNTTMGVANVEGPYFQKWVFQKPSWSALISESRYFIQWLKNIETCARFVTRYCILADYDSWSADLQDRGCALDVNPPPTLIFRCRVLRFRIL